MPFLGIPNFKECSSACVMHDKSFRNTAHQTLKINFGQKFPQYRENFAGHAKDAQIKSMIIEDNNLIKKERFF